MLSAMEDEGVSFDEILQRAQALGYAEADPSFDVDGIDAAHKLTILMALAYGTGYEFSKVHVEGIRAVTPVDMVMPLNWVIALNTWAYCATPTRVLKPGCILHWCPIANWWLM